MIVEGLGKIENLESTGSEETSKRSEGEIGAMLVIEIPECPFAQDTRHVGNLEEDHGGRFVSDCAPDGLDELLGGMNVFKRVAAADQVAPQIAVTLRIEIANKGNSIRGRARQPAGHIAGIDSDAPIIAELAERCQKVAFSAADLDQ